MTRFARVEHEGRATWLRVDDGAVLKGAPWVSEEVTGTADPTRLPRLPPATPSKLVCVGRN